MREGREDPALAKVSLLTTPPGLYRSVGVELLVASPCKREENTGRTPR